MHFPQFIWSAGGLHDDDVISPFLFTTEDILQEWYNKPTLKSAINDKRKGCFYEFGKDDSVVYSYITNDGSKKQIEWSIPVETSYIDGDELNGRFDECINDYVEPIPCCVCGLDCEGGDYELWRFCSRSCMVKHQDDRY